MTLLHIAPHLVRPLRFTWPVYQGARVPGWKLGAGLMLYDALALWRNVARHRRLTAGGVLLREPELDPRGLTSGAEYFDAATDDARLTLANALAAAGSGAAILNHAPVRSITHDASGRAVGAQVYDTLSGETLSVRASAIVNATGPWTDSVRQLADPLGTPSVRGSKGVHLAVPAHRIGNRGAVTLLSAIDGRVMFVLPAGRLTIIGTTESDTTAAPDDVRAASADIEYLVSSVNSAFPRARLDRRDVVSAWAGIRPLAASGHPSDAASASREHEIERAPSGMVTITGGKLTTYRAMAAEVVDTVLAELERPVVPTTTHVVPLPGRGEPRPWMPLPRQTRVCRRPSIRSCRIASRTSRTVFSASRRSHSPTCSCAGRTWRSRRETAASPWHLVLPRPSRHSWTGMPQPGNERSTPMPETWSACSAWTTRLRLMDRPQLQDLQTPRQRGQLEHGHVARSSSEQCAPDRR